MPVSRRPDCDRARLLLGPVCVPASTALALRERRAPGEERCFHATRDTRRNGGGACAIACREQRGESGRPSGWLLRWTKSSSTRRVGAGARVGHDARPIAVSERRPRASSHGVLALPDLGCGFAPKLLFDAWDEPNVCCGGDGTHDAPLVRRGRTACRRTRHPLRRDRRSAQAVELSPASERPRTRVPRPPVVTATPPSTLLRKRCRGSGRRARRPAVHGRPSPRPRKPGRAN